MSPPDRSREGCAACSGSVAIGHLTFPAGPRTTAGKPTDPSRAAWRDFRSSLHFSPVGLQVDVPMTISIGIWGEQAGMSYVEVLHVSEDESRSARVITGVTSGSRAALDETIRRQ